MFNKSISVVIPNYNGARLLKAHLPSVFSALQKVGCDSEVIIVDDHSNDESIKFIEENYPQVKLIENEQNQGFSATINRGIYKAQYDLVFCLNNDVGLDINYFVSQYKYFLNKKTFGVMGKIIDGGNGKMIDSAKYPRFSLLKGGINGALNYYIPEKQDEDTFVPSFFLSGANCLIDRKKLIKLGGFDEIYSPYYFEDLDLSLRAWRFGWYCWYDEKAVCGHVPSSTIKKSSPSNLVKIVSGRNKLILHAIHLDEVNLFVWNLIITLKLMFSWLSLNFTFYKIFGEFLKKREDVKKSRIKLKRLLDEENAEKRSVLKVVKFIKNQISAFNIIKY